MDPQEEYHDPDYPGTSVRVKEDSSSFSEDEKVEKIKRIVRREFTNELEVRENEVMLIEQRMSTSRRMLHRLRYALVNSYYRDQKLQLTNGQLQDEVAAQHEPRARAEVSSLLRDGQRRLHPSVRKLLGKQTADLDEILFQGRAPRTKARKDYSAMVRSRNYTIAADTTKSLRPEDAPQEEPGSSRPKKVPRHFEPKITNVVTLDEATRNQMKYRYRIIIGNTSKYAPPASRADRSTHKWLLYVRGPGGGAGGAGGDLSRIVTAVTVTLHHSYAPHHTVHIDKPPFHISRRGWGEFPARVQLHFALPERNRPATLEHTIKLDRNYTGLQTLGAETIVDVWLYSTSEMLQFEYKEDINIEVPTHTAKPDIPLKPEPTEPEQVTENESDTQTDSWLDFFSKDTILNVDEMIIKPEKKIEEKNDLETLIETSVINKELDKVGDLEETINHIDSKINTEIAIENNVVRTGTDECSTIVSNDRHLRDSEDIPNELLIQPTSPKKRIMKYMDPTTGKIYYLEMDRKLDLSKVQEIVINSKGNVKTAKISPIKPNGLKNVRKNSKKGGVSLLKPELKSLLKTENTLNPVKIEKQKSVLRRNYTHIENDHCYLGTAWSKSLSFQEEKHDFTLPVTNPTDNITNEVVVKKEKSLFDTLCSSICRFTCVRVAVNYLLKKIPLICEEARDPDFLKHFPFVVENEQRYWRLDFAKRRNIEWTRAKLINRLLNQHFNTQHGAIWRTKQLLIYSRLHGFYPIRSESVQHESQSEIHTEWSSWTDLENSRKLESNIKEFYPSASDICSLTQFDSTEYSNLSESIELAESDEEVEVVNDVAVIVKKEVTETAGNLSVLPVESEEDRLRFMFIERKCADIGIELRNEDVGSGYSYSAVHAVLLSAMRSFAEELVRSALAETLLEAAPSGPDAVPPVWLGPSSRTVVPLRAAWRGARRAPRLRTLARAALGTREHTTYRI